MAFAVSKLFSIRKKHLAYLLANNLNIMLIADINWETPISAHCAILLPYELACDIEEMFWVD